MKTILMLILALPLVAFASVETTIDLAKFSELAEKEIEAAYGAGSLAKDSVQFVFVDGAGSLYMNPTADLAHLNFLAKVKVDSPEQTHLVAFRLMLGGGRLELRRVRRFEDRLFYSIPGSAMVTLKDSTPDNMQELADAILAMAPDAKVQVLSSAGIILFDCLPKHAVKIENYLRQNRQVVAVETNGEHFGMDAAFASLETLNSKVLKLDLDTLRTLSKELREQGVTLEPAAFVPPSLR